ncbi:hypothetical protein [Ruminococcus sp.]|uniref:hypothetical protein n=1 Tax=Ruminococcus sp. TaxID=41978 RepID=UPI001B6CE2DD|nr:hypothetical protein [Ruminococcus sp.]MBP5433594.1 hypothetical protein [Ruminococcus sp.]
MGEPLRYVITDWHQLKNIKSNNSNQLSVRVADLLQSDILTGLRIQIYHEDYGPLYAAVLNASGSIVTEVNDNVVTEPSTEYILAELYKWGFIVEFEQALHLPQGQLDFLAELKTLGYDKIRILNVWHIEHGVKQFKPYIIVFNVEQNPVWLNNGYAASESEFMGALKNGSAVNISATTKANMWSWGFLYGYVMNIDDILNN